MVNNLPPLAGPVDASGEPVDLTNHHNAARCPYCNPLLDSQYMEISRLKSDVAFWKGEFDKLRAAAVPSSPAQEEEPPSVACPVCGIVVQQVASATLSLTLWQHWNWVCDRRTIPPPPRLTDLQRICNLNVMQAMAVQQYIERLALPSSPSVADSPTIEQAFKAGYHCRWHQDQGFYCFDPLMSPGDPDGAYQAWLASAPSPSAGAAQKTDIKNTKG